MMETWLWKYLFDHSKNYYSISSRNMKYNFALSKLVIRNNERWNPNVLRILKQGETYVFNKYADKDNVVGSDFFLNGVTVSAIVGKNGSGKSSLLDLIYRMLNNFGYCLKNCLKNKPKDLHLGYVPNIYAELYFVEIDNKTGERRLGCLHNDGDVIAIEFGDKKYRFLAVRNGKEEDENFADYELLNDMTRKELGKLSHYLFHTIVINYSMQAFLPDEYDKDGTIWPDDKEREFLLNNTWIDEMFHKNDGYQTPIVLNPYRDHGKIDMTNIDGLVDSYALSLLIFYKQRKRNNEFIPGYTTGDILYKRNDEAFIEKCRKYTKTASNDRFMGIFCASVKDQSHYASQIIQAYGFNIVNAKGLTAELFLYLVYKTINIAFTYSDYEEYKNLGNLKNITKGISQKDFAKTQSDIRGLVNQILIDRSHITFKIRQTCYLLRCLENVDIEPDLVKLLLAKEFSIERYRELTSKAWKMFADRKHIPIPIAKALHLEQIIQTLPPPIFSVQISLEKRDGEKIDFHHLSSGERQFIHVLSTIVYHVNNIISIKSPTRLQYRKINIVLDEAELCSHPDMQRQYLNTILNYLSVTGLTWGCAFHLLIVTHSPFILSDIPQSNILYLENGRQKNTEDVTVNPFGANVNDVLAQSFFLNKGFVGEFAKSKIESLVVFLKTGKKTRDNWTLKKAEAFIDRIVGEPIVRMMLKGMLHDKNIR